MKNYLLILNAILSFQYLFGQQNKIDSLLTLLKTDKEDTNKVMHLNKLCKEYMKVGSYNIAMERSRDAMQISEKLNFKKGVANSNTYIGLIYGHQGNYSDALKYYFESLKIQKELNNKQEIANSYNNIGLVYWNQGNYSEALKNHFASLKIREEIGDKRGIAGSHGNIGNVYYSQGNHPVALKNHFASLKIREEIKDKQGIANSYSSIGLIYADQGNSLEALKNYSVALKTYEELGIKDAIAGSYNNIGIIYNNQGNNAEALKNYFTALKINEEMNDKQGIAASYNNIGIIYVEQADNLIKEKGSSDSVAGKLADALKNYFKALNIYKEFVDKDGMASSFINLGVVHTKLNKLTEAEDYLNKGLILSKELGSKEYIKASYSGLAILDSTIGNCKAEIKNYRLFILYRDSLDNEETRKKTIQQSMTYDFEKKELATQAIHDKQTVISVAESKRQQIFLWFIGAVALGAGLIAIIILRSLRITRRQKTIIETQKYLVEQKQKEILDSINYAKRIQDVLLPSENYFKQNLNRLQKI